MNLLAQQLVNGLFIGSVYGLFAVGYTLVFGVLDILNLAHAAVFTLGGLRLCGWLQDRRPFDLAGLPSRLLFAGLLGSSARPGGLCTVAARADTNFSGLISSIAMAIIFEGLAMGVFGAHTVRFPANTVTPHIWRFARRSR